MSDPVTIARKVLLDALAGLDSVRNDSQRIEYALIGMYVDGDARERTGVLRAVRFLPGAATDAAALPAGRHARGEALAEMGALVAAGCAYHAWFSPEMPYVWLALALMAQGGGLALVSTSTAAAVTSDSDARDLGASSAALGLTAALANAGGMALLLGTLEWLGGDGEPSAYRGAFALAAGLAVAVALLPIRGSRPEH